MAITETHTVGSPSTGGTTREATHSCTAGHTALAIVWWYGSADISSVALTGESNLTLIGSKYATGGPGGTTQFAVLNSISSTGSKTVTVTFSAALTAGRVILVDIDGANTSGAAGVRASNNGNSTAPSATLNGCAANSAIFGICLSGSGGQTAGTNYTSLGMTNYWNAEFAEVDTDSGSAGNIVADLTITESAWLIDALEIKLLDSGTSVGMSGSALTGGTGANAPGTSVGL